MAGEQEFFLYIFAKKNRKNQFFIPPITPEQEEHKNHLLQHIRKLSALYGNVKVAPETMEYLANWWDDQENNKSKRANQNIKLKAYYSRRNIHVMKIAMAKHFGESTEMLIPLETFVWAINFLTQEEKNMHLALAMEGDNPVSKISKKVLDMLGAGEKDWVSIYVEGIRMGNKAEIEEALSFLIETGEIAEGIGKHPVTQKEFRVWRLKQHGETPPEPTQE